MTRNKFGTDGWRAAIAEDFTFHNVRRCARGVAEYLAATGTADRGVVVCHDRRFASEHFARACVEVLAAHGIHSFTPPEAVPTQVGSFFTREMGAGAGSSSPPATTRGPTTASRSRPIPAVPEPRRCWPPSRRPWIATPRTSCHPAESMPMPLPPGWSRSSTRIRASGSSWPASSTWSGSGPQRKVLVEPLYGSGAGWFTRLLGDASLTIRELHTERNPYFGGVNPEPIRPTSTPGWRRSRAGAPTSGSPSTATRTGSGWRPRRGSSSTSCRSTGSSTGTCSTCEADRPRGLHRHHHLDGAAPGRDLRHPGLRDRGRLKFVGPR